MASPRLIISIILSFLLFDIGLVTAANQDHTNLTFASLTGCAASCLRNSTSRYCTIDDTLCLCTSPGFMTDWTTCTHNSCSAREILLSRRTQAAVCHFEHPNKSGEQTAVTVVLFSIVVVFVGLRLASRRLAGEFFIEDVLIFLATVTSVALLVPHLIAINSGFGKHYYDLSDGAMTRIVEPVYIIENFYVLTLTFVRISFLCLYLRLFHRFGWFRALIFGIAVVFIVANGTALVLTILSCRPMERIWDTQNTRDAACMNVHSLGTAVATLSVAEDFLLILLPLLPLLVDRMKQSPTAGTSAPLRTRLYFAGTFAVGILAAAAGAYRLDNLLRIGTSTDPSWDYMPVAYWSFLEFTAGIVAACLPSIRTLAHIVLMRKGITWLSDDEESRGTIYYIRDGADKRGRTAGAASVADQAAMDDNLRISKRYNRASWVDGSPKSLAVVRPAAVYCHPVFDSFEDSEAPSPAENEATPRQSGQWNKDMKKNKWVVAYHHPSLDRSDRSDRSDRLDRSDRVYRVDKVDKVDRLDRMSKLDRETVVTVSELHRAPTPAPASASAPAPASASASAPAPAATSAGKSQHGWRRLFGWHKADKNKNNTEGQIGEPLEEPMKDWRHSNWG